MARSALTGTRIRERRMVLGMKQAELARLVEISPSYLNLIEHNRRRIGGKLLVAIARALGVDVPALTEGAEAALLDLLREAAGAAPEVEAELERVDEFVGRFPGWAALAADQHRRAQSQQERLKTLADRLNHDPFLSGAMHEMLSKIAAIRSTAAILAETDDLDAVWRRRFHRNLHHDSEALADGSAALVAYFEGQGEEEPVRMAPQDELELFLEAADHHFAALETEAREAAADRAAEDLVAASQVLQSDDSRALARRHLARYRADAAAMPLAEMTTAAAAAGFDPARLAARFGTRVEAVFRRLATLPPTGGERIGLAVCDGAGALTFRKPAERFPLPRFGAACPLWPLYQALARPMTPIRTVVAHAASPEHPFVVFARSAPLPPADFAGPPVWKAQMLIVPAALVGGAAGKVEASVGSHCRVCPRRPCPARREPSITAVEA